MLVDQRTAVVLLLLSGGVLLLGQRDGGQVEGGDGDVLGGWSIDALTDNAVSIFNQAQDTISMETNPTPPDVAASNLAAFLSVIAQAEGADYGTCYGYSHTIQDFSDHPAVTGEWRGVVLTDAQCANAGFGSGCKSTAAGRYQINRPTWNSVKAALGLPDFSPASQDAAAVELIRRRGALAAVQGGDLATAVSRCRNEWASLPGNYAGQGQRSQAQLSQWFADAGGQAVTA